jgi:hypothetical protein
VDAGFASDSDSGVAAMSAFEIIVIILALYAIHVLRRIALNQVAQATHRTNIHQVEIAVLKAIQKEVKK